MHPAIRTAPFFAIDVALVMRRSIVQLVMLLGTALGFRRVVTRTQKMSSLSVSLREHSTESAFPAAFVAGKQRASTLLLLKRIQSTIQVPPPALNGHASPIQVGALQESGGTARVSGSSAAPIFLADDRCFASFMHSTTWRATSRIRSGNSRCRARLSGLPNPPSESPAGQGLHDRAGMSRPGA